MRHALVCMLLLVSAAPATGKQQVQPESESDARASLDHARQLLTCRQGLVDPLARPEGRRLWARNLLSYHTEPADELVVELLSFADNPDVPRALCTVLADRAEVAVDDLVPSFLAPLIELLGAEAEDIRALAAQVLADCPQENATSLLAALAAAVDAPLPKRLAAIDALALNRHRREVVGPLISLLDADNPAITDKIVSVLEPLTPVSFGRSKEPWRSWWRVKSRMTEAAWLSDQFLIHRDRSRRIADEFQAFRGDARLQQEKLTTRMRSFLRELYRQSGEQKAAKLVEWLGDPLTAVKLAALSIIKARMADEGSRPEGELLTAMLTLLDQASPEAQIATLEIVRRLKEPAVAAAVLARVELEQDRKVRQALLRALGQLDDPAVMPALVREIASPDSSTACVRAAAIALSAVAARTDLAERGQAAADALRQRYEATPTGETTLRRDLLTAMAGVADPSFEEIFLQAIDSDDPAILRWAVRGLRAIENRAKLPRIRTLTEHADAMVRLEAIEALGRLGGEQADLERLLTRLSQANEPSERARTAAWQGFVQFFAARPLADRIAAAERLREQPALEARYLDHLIAGVGTTNGSHGERDALRDRLATVLVAQERHAEAIQHLRALYATRRTQSDPAALDIGIRLLNATLRSGSAASDVGPLVAELAALSMDQPARERIVNTLAVYLDSANLVSDPDRTRQVIVGLRAQGVEGLGDAWAQLIERIDTRVQLSADKATEATSNPRKPGT